MKAIYDVLAPAKLNLFLHITGRRADGYHLLQSVFALIDWCDVLHFELRSDGKITRTDLNTQSEPLPAQDLAVKAAQALQAACGTDLGVHISLDKHIPSQAGMGGGSSDAASCLLALQRLWGVRLAPEKLLTLAQGLGADVPFFLCGEHAWVEGTGECITPIQLPPTQFLVLQPAAGVSTQAVFSAPHLKRDTQAVGAIDFLAHAVQGQVTDFGCNDLQPVALELCSEIGEGLDWLSKQGLQGKMTGSGSAVFAQIRQPIDLTTLPNAWRARHCKALQKNPLFGW